MKFIVSSSLLYKELQNLGGIINSTNTIPILDNFLFNIEKNKLKITSSDLESSMTSEIETARRLSLTWGTNTLMSGAKQRFKEAVVSAVRGALSEGYALENDQIVITAGVPFNIPGTTNILRVAPCNERMIYSMDPE